MYLPVFDLIRSLVLAVLLSLSTKQAPEPAVVAQSAPEPLGRPVGLVESVPPRDGCPVAILTAFEGSDVAGACAISYCESRWFPGAVGDHGQSLGLFQLWVGWADWYGVEVAALFDPAINATVARAVLEYRGRWSGGGGWTCAGLLGIW